MAAVDDATARRLAKAAADLGMDVLAEVHDEAELVRALKLDTRSSASTTATSRVSPHACYHRASGADVAADRIVIAESGIFAHADLERLACSACGPFSWARA